MTVSGDSLAIQPTMNIDRDYLWDGSKGLESSKILTSLVGWGKKVLMEEVFANGSQGASGTLGKLLLQRPTLSCCFNQGKVLMVVDHEGAQSGQGSTSPHSAPWTGSQSLWNPRSIPSPLIRKTSQRPPGTPALK